MRSLGSKTTRFNSRYCSWVAGASRERSRRDRAARSLLSANNEAGDGWGVAPLLLGGPTTARANYLLHDPTQREGVAAKEKPEGEPDLESMRSITLFHVFGDPLSHRFIRI